MELHESGLNEKVQLATGQQLYPLLVFLEGKLPQYCAVYNHVLIGLRTGNPIYRVYFARNLSGEYAAVVALKKDHRLNGRNQLQTIWTVTSWAEDEETRIGAFKSIDDIDWNMEEFVIVGPNDEPPSVMKEFFSDLGKVQKNYYANIFTMERQAALNSELRSSSDVYVKSLEIEHAATVYKHWPYNETTTVDSVVESIIETPSAGVFLKDTDQLVSWMISRTPNGMAKLHTLEGFRRRGYASFVAKYLSKRMAQSGFLPFVDIVPENESSRKCFTNLGFSSVMPVYCLTAFLPESKQRATSAEDEAVDCFRRYLRIKTVQPKPDYYGAIAFLTGLIQDIGLEHKLIERDPHRPILIASWIGEEPNLATILLNSHMDVVPVSADRWKFDPFTAIKENGRIYGRGSQDMKCVTIQYLAAIRRLREKGIRNKRTVHLTFMPDEEVGGKLGMEVFVKSDDWQELKVGFVLDEGLADPSEAFTVFYGERIGCWVKVTCPGNPGHGSRFIEGSAAEKLRQVISKFLDFRQREKLRLETNHSLTLGDVTTVNLTKIEGGVQVNVVPSELTAYFDVRVAPNDMDYVEEQLYRWCREAGSDVSFEFLYCLKEQTLTSIEPGNIWWDAFSSACQSMQLTIRCEIFPAGTDSRYLRAIGLPALGFSPINKTPILLHDHNEFLDESVFLRGIDIYEAIIPSLANA